MAQPKTISLTGDGTGATNSDPYPINWRSPTFGIGLFFDTDGSTTGFTVQYTGDDPQASYSTDFNTDAKWFDHPDMAAMTADDDGNIEFPVRAIRLRADANGTDTGELTIVEGGQG